jgi:hypothetical protein
MGLFAPGRCWAWRWAPACTKRPLPRWCACTASDARNPITGITLIAGFASTVGWPLVGVDGHALRLARRLLRLGRAAPAAGPAAERLAAGPAAAPDGAPSARGAGSAAPPPTPHRPHRHAHTGGAAGLRVRRHLVRQHGHGHAPAAAAAGRAPAWRWRSGVGALVGPAQVAGRLLEFGVLRRLHPLLSARLASLGHPMGRACCCWLRARRRRCSRCCTGRATAS